MVLAIGRTGFRDLDVAGIRLRRVVQLTGDTSYPTGGYSLTPGDVKLGVIEHFPTVAITDGTTIRIGVYNYTTQKLQFFVPNTNVEVANAVDLSTFSARVEVIGK